eukprot:gb/GECG01005926.1/.p1 GENE.gb/GECG01005926.1/~~gb/GECG01005926.1/.p1  ORF type:complete len:174 (+),score=23.32 gb/GECG01005926.1/:1-522(+)
MAAALGTPMWPIMDTKGLGSVRLQNVNITGREKSGQEAIVRVAAFLEARGLKVTVCPAQEEVHFVAQKPGDDMWILGKVGHGLDSKQTSPLFNDPRYAVKFVNERYDKDVKEKNLIRTFWRVNPSLHTEVYVCDVGRSRVSRKSTAFVKLISIRKEQCVPTERAEDRFQCLEG